MTETLEEVAINDDGYPRVSEICLNHILGLNQLSQEQLQRLMEIEIMININSVQAVNAIGKINIAKIITLIS